MGDFVSVPDASFEKFHIEVMWKCSSDHGWLDLCNHDVVVVELHKCLGRFDPFSHKGLQFIWFLQLLLSKVRHSERRNQKELSDVLRISQRIVSCQVATITVSHEKEVSDVSDLDSPLLNMTNKVVDTLFRCRICLKVLRSIACSKARMIEQI